MELTIEKAVEEENENNETLLYLEGRLTTSSADYLEKRLSEEFEDPDCKHIILDLRAIDMLSSMGIRVFLKTYKNAMINNKKFEIQNPSKPVRNVLGLANLEQLLAK